MAGKGFIHHNPLFYRYKMFHVKHLHLFRHRRESEGLSIPSPLAGEGKGEGALSYCKRYINNHPLLFPQQVGEKTVIIWSINYMRHEIPGYRYRSLEDDSFLSGEAAYETCQLGRLT